jgi:uncharacterized repeat protein (TIGR03803 family)
VLYRFTGIPGVDGMNPRQGLVRDSKDNLYGTTPQGGSNNFGVVFKIDTKDNETVLHTFSGSDGKTPTEPSSSTRRETSMELRTKAEPTSSSSCSRSP